jgi:hypothetical protein
MIDNANGPARAHDSVVSLHPGAVKRYLEVGSGWRHCPIRKWEARKAVPLVARWGY